VNAKIMKINRQTYEEFFLLYTDGELNSEERTAVEEFVRENPDLEPELLLLQQTILSPQETILFENKESLFRHEESRKLVFFAWHRIAAAAVVVLFLSVAGWLWLQDRQPAGEPILAKLDSVKDENNTLQPVEPVGTASSPVQSPGTEFNNNRPAPALPETVSYTTTTAKPGKPIPSNAVQITAPSADMQNTTAVEMPETTDNAALTPEPSEEIGATVQPRKISPPVEDITYTVNNDKIATVEYASPEEDNTIYFANTALPKKTKLRGVFRKASRILDKVTSFQ